MRKAELAHSLAAGLQNSERYKVVSHKHTPQRNEIILGCEQRAVLFDPIVCSLLKGQFPIILAILVLSGKY